MTAKEYLLFLKNEIHSTVFATVDKNGLPQTCVIDIMLCDEDSLYFLTAKGKAFYDRLTAQSYVAISGMRGKELLHLMVKSSVAQNKTNRDTIQLDFPQKACIIA